MDAESLGDVRPKSWNALALAILLWVTFPVATAMAQVPSDGQPAMTWLTDKSGLDLGVPSATQKTPSDGPLDVTVGLRNSGSTSVFCSSRWDDSYAEMSDGKGHNFASLFPRDRDTKRIPVKTEIKPGDLMVQRISLLKLGINSLVPGLYDVSLTRFCGGAGDIRIQWNFRLDVSA